jgi:magnesium chelatase accessory protein
MTDRLRWDRDALDWPHRTCSRFVEAGGLRWHVQRMGAGPTALLIHGTGASTHSWRGLMPLLAKRFDVVAMDLPGHAFTSTPPSDGLALDGMARSVGALVKAMELDVRLLLSHSAGAAIGARLVLDGKLAPTLAASINGAYFALRGLAGLAYPAMARLMAATPVGAWLFARRDWDRRSVERLLAGTGSSLDDEGVALYGRLIRDPSHAAGALGMMAAWDLRALERDFIRWHTPLVLLVGQNDRAVKPADAYRLRDRLGPSVRCTVDLLPGLGHLAHEEQPALVESHLVRAWEAA